MLCGFQRGYVAAGAGTLVVFSLITVALIFITGRLFYLPAILAFGGLMLMIKGLIGEEGVW